VREALQRTVRIGEPEEGRMGLLSTAEISSFRAVRAGVELVDEHAVIGQETAEALRLSSGDPIRVKL
jgi:arginine N-succinyltransferase